MVQGVEGVRHGAERTGAGSRRTTAAARGLRAAGGLLAWCGLVLTGDCGEPGTVSKPAASTEAKSGAPRQAPAVSKTKAPPKSKAKATGPGSTTAASAKPKAAAPAEIGHAPVPLFDGKSLAGWEVTVFGGDGECTVENGCLVLGTGVDLTGVKTTRPLESLPKTNYEVTLSARRVEGSDFFCGLTFPVPQGFCSLIVGGWGGGVCGLSCIDGMDAAHNDTTTYRTFENGRWYPVKVRVTDSRIEAWLDGAKIVDQDIAGKKIAVRGEVELSKPLGLASWQTTAAVKDVHIRRLRAADIPAPAPSLPEGP